MMRLELGFISGLATWGRGRTSTPYKNGVARIGRGSTDPRFDYDFPDDMVFAKGRRTMEEQQQQEQPKESTLAELVERIKKLEGYVARQAVPTFDDIYKMFAAALKKAQAFEVETIKKCLGTAR